MSSAEALRRMALASKHARARAKASGARVDAVYEAGEIVPVVELKPVPPSLRIVPLPPPPPSSTTTTRAKIASDELRDALDAARRVCDAAERRSEASREALDRARELETSTTRLLAATSR
jgi:hypothetical protein